MVRFVLIGIMGLLICFGSRAQEAKGTPARVAIENPDSTTYELFITDIYFDHWYLLNFNPGKDRSDEYYEANNILAVQRWNDCYRKGLHSEVINTDINYQSTIAYGIELNRKLYWYFKYITSEFNIPLLQ